MEIKAAIYCRLSQDDGSVGESGSIQTQRTLLEQYCREKHFPIYDYYCDDGWSGTNFERPEFKRMMADVEAQKINMIIVKDLSRFGRDYAQMGLYIEHYFEEKSIRFISVAENIDSASGVDNLVLPFTNVINSYYARQCSTKTKAAHVARAKAGMFLGSHAPFGYVKDPQDRHHLIIDPPAAETVLRIFKMFAQGIGYVRITKLLREDGVLNPQTYFNQNNPDFYTSDYWRKPYDWHATSVRVILNNPVYLGKLVYGKTRSKGFFDKTRIATTEDEQIIVEGTHEPIVTQELWDSVHVLMENRRRECKGSGEIQMFAGLVKCAGCGSSLNLSYSTQKKCYKNFSCWVYKNYGKQRCTSHAIGYKTLCTLVLEDIRQQAACAEAFTEQYLEMLTRQADLQRESELKTMRHDLKAADKRIADLTTIMDKLYEDHALGRISGERYTDMFSRYETEQVELRDRRRQLDLDIIAAETAQNGVNQHMRHIRKYTDIQALDAQILNELIEKIVVHEKVRSEDGKVSQQVDIYYRFVGIIRVV